jgi:hypothetical protein
MQTKLSTWTLLSVGIAFLLLAGFDRNRQDQPEGYSAGAIGTGGGMGGRTVRFQFRVQRWTSDEEVKQFAETLRVNGPVSLRRALERVRVGRIAPVGSVGNDIAVARQRRDGASTVITIVTVRNMAFLELSRGRRSRDYPFGYLQVTLDQKGEGSGQIMVAAKIRFNEKKGTTEIESYGNQHIRVVNVRPLR